MSYQLFEQLAHRYDLHTPPEHYQHDHAWVLEQARTEARDPRLLDIGCGTGVLVEKACRVGIDAHGIDVASGMVQVARRRVGQKRISLRGMEDLDDEAAWHAVTALSWTLNYCDDLAALAGVVQRIYRALLPDGRILLQVAHAPNATGEWWQDHEPDPSGNPGGVVFGFRFQHAPGDPPGLLADYTYACPSEQDFLEERHHLHVADAHAVARTLTRTGFVDVAVYDSYRMEPLADSVSAWVVGRRPPS